jgi:hypothetical protein
MDPTIYRTLLAIDPNTNFPISTNYMLSTDGFGDLSWQNIIYNLSTISQDVGVLPSTIVSLSTQIYNLQQISPGSAPVLQFTSTVAGLGSIGYISTSQLTSTVRGLGSIGYFSSLSSLASLGYVSSTQLTSTVEGLGTSGYISSSQLISSIIGLGSSRYVSSSQLASTLSNLGTTGYVSSASLFSTLRGLGTTGYISSSQLISTVTGLGSIGYVSQATLSTTVGERLNVFFNTANTLSINGNNNYVFISSMNEPYFFSSIFNSSITYKGNNGALVAQQSTTGITTDFYISTLNTQFDSFSSFINDRTRLTLDIYPNILFTNINTNGISRTFSVSSFLQYGGSPILNPIHQTLLYGINNAASNSFNPSMRLNVTGSIINSNYVNPYVLVHRVVSAADVAPNTFSNPNVTLFFDSTTSYYLTIQNLTN